MKRFALVGLPSSCGAGVGPKGPGCRHGCLRTAMNTEMVDGDLEDAIARYKKLAAIGDRSVAAQALLRMAEVMQLRQPAARETYRTIVRDYPDQPVATIARTRL